MVSLPRYLIMYNQFSLFADLLSENTVIFEGQNYYFFLSTMALVSAIWKNGNISWPF